uniref:Uncharacterized protein n=1 Tax=Chlorobium chlorochromatii (strain CaD3) TaxID=340177 RepID=Q3AT26_CHLCH
MKTITVQLPDEVHKGMTMVAATQHISISKLYEYISQNMLRGYAAEVRFRERVAQGSRKKGLAVLDKLDECYGE